MYAIKFDEEKINNAINAFYDTNGRYPYLICNRKTEKLCLECVKKESNGTISIGSFGAIGTNNITPNPPKIVINDIEFVSKNSIDNTPNKWNNATILIDQNLKFGEIIIA